MNKTQTTEPKEIPDFPEVPETPKLKYPPKNFEDFKEQSTKLFNAKQELKICISECPTEYCVFSNLIGAYNIMLRKEKQMIIYAKANGWL